jgi:hypothetical protein
VDDADAAGPWPARLAVRPRPLLMTDVDTSAAIAAAALDPATELADTPTRA